MFYLSKPFNNPKPPDNIIKTFPLSIFAVLKVHPQSNKTLAILRSFRFKIYIPVFLVVL